MKKIIIAIAITIALSSVVAYASGTTYNNYTTTISSIEGDVVYVPIGDDMYSFVGDDFVEGQTITITISSDGEIVNAY